MVSFTVLLITVLPLTYLLTSVMSSAADSRQRTSALQLADSWLEILSNTQPPVSNGIVITNTPTDPSTFTNITAANTQIPTSTLAGTTYAVSADYVPQSVNNQGGSDLCSSGQPPSPSHPDVILLQVTVSWNHGNSSVSDTTAVDYPQPGLQTQGFLSVQLANSGVGDVNGNTASDRLRAVPITLSQQTATDANNTWISSSHMLTLYPDENGCVFAQVPTGNYVVSAGQPTSGKPATFTGYSGTPAFVTTGGTTTDTSSATAVTVTAESDVQLTAFDEGITSSIAYGSSAGVDGGVTCPGTNALTCVTTGNGTSGAAAAWGGAGSNWASTTFSGVTNFAPVACTTGSSPTCVAAGYHASGAIIRTTSSDLGTTSTDTVPSGVTDISQVACPSSNGCYALATTALGPVLLAGAVGQTGSQHDTWAAVSPAATTFTSLSSLACPTTSTCEVTGAVVGLTPSVPVILRLDGDPATLATNGSWTPTFSTDTLPGTVSSVGKITCPSTALCEALAVGDSSSATDPTVLTATIGATPPSTWTTEPSFPTGAAAIYDISCTSTTCVAVGSASNAAAVWTADLTQSPHDWSTATTLPNSVAAVSAVACGQPASGDAADCVVAANTTNPASPSSPSTPGQLLEGSLASNGGWAWNVVTPSGASVRFYTGVACEPAPSSSRAVCAAVGSTASGPVVATTSSGPAGAWSVQTPNSLPGTVVNGIPLQTAPAGANGTWTTQVTWAQAASANFNYLPSVLYPQPNGYSLASGDCKAEALSPAVSSLTAAPGGNATATVPVNLLTLQVVTSAGVPMSGATVKLSTATAGCATTDTFTLPASDAYGYVHTAIPYGTFTYTVTAQSGLTTAPAGATLTATNPAYVTVTKSSPASTVNTYLPQPVVVASS